MTKYEDTEKETEKKYAEIDKKKAPKMHMSGRSVLQLKKIIEHAAKPRINKKTI